jgi:hypothetical protein
MLQLTHIVHAPQLPWRPGAPGATCVPPAVSQSCMVLLLCAGDVDQCARCVPVPEAPDTIHAGDSRGARRHRHHIINRRWVAPALLLLLLLPPAAVLLLAPSYHSRTYVHSMLPKLQSAALNASSFEVIYNSVSRFRQAGTALVSRPFSSEYSPACFLWCMLLCVAFRGVRCAIHMRLLCCQAHGSGHDALPQRLSTPHRGCASTASTLGQQVG